MRIRSDQFVMLHLSGFEFSKPISKRKQPPGMFADRTLGPAPSTQSTVVSHQEGRLTEQSRIHGKENLMFHHARIDRHIDEDTRDEVPQCEQHKRRYRRNPAPGPHISPAATQRCCVAQREKEQIHFATLLSLTPNHRCVR